MSSPPASSAAGLAPELDDPLFRQVQAVYSFFKDPVGVTLNRTNCTPEEHARHRAASTLNKRAERAPNVVAPVWGDLSQVQRELLVEVLLGYYCNSRTDPGNRALPISFDQVRNEIACAANKNVRQKQQIPADLLDPAKRLNKLWSLLVTLYNAPINEREHVPFERQRHEVGEARRQVARATSTTPHRLEHAQRTYDAAEAALAARLRTANDARIVHLQQVKAAFSLLHDSASLVPGFDNEAHGVALEVYVSRLDQGQQDAAVARVRDFVFAACEERAVRGEALDPNAPLVEILHALHAHDLGHALCAARLNSILHFYMFDSGDASAVIVEHVQGIVDEFCSEVWTRRFRQLAFSQQLYAVGMVRALLKRIQTLEARQVVDQLANIFPMNSPSQASWKHAPGVEGPPVALRSLARSTSTRQVPRHADSTTSAASSPYFPQARSARW